MAIRSTRLNGINPLSYLGVNPYTPPGLITQNRAPTPNDSKGYFLGDFWLVEPIQQLPPLPQELWVLVSLVGHVATWVQLYPAGPGGATEFPTDAGIANEAGGILNVFGDTVVTTSGAGNTITIHAGSTIATSYLTDAGTAIPAGNALDVFGGTGINTAGAGAVLSIAVDGDVPLQFDTDAGNAVPAGNILTVIGGTGIDTAGFGSTVSIAVTGDVATTYTTNAGMATPAVNNLNIVGDGAITTTGAGSTVTVHFPSTTPLVWTPILQFGGAAVGITYAIQGGVFVTLGNVTWWSFSIQLTNKGSSVGAATVTGMPWTVVGGGGGKGYIGNFNINYSAGSTDLQYNIMDTTLFLEQTGSGVVAVTNLTNVNFANNSEFSAQGVYFTPDPF